MKSQPLRGLLIPIHLLNEGREGIRFDTYFGRKLITLNVDRNPNNSESTGRRLIPLERDGEY